MESRWQELCLGNRYATTLHVINSAVVKLGKLQPAMKVYRGVTGGVLPEIFWKANQHNVRGGCEYGFLSTTTDARVATDYAGSSGKSGIVFEIAMGMVDRGASLSWLSQYPHEREYAAHERRSPSAQPAHATFPHRRAVAPARAPARAPW